MFATTTLTNFLISLLIWTFHLSFYQITISIIIMMLLIKLIINIKLFDALLLAGMAQSFSLFVLFLICGIVTYGLKIPYVILEEDIEKQYTILVAALNFGLINTLLQILFFTIFQKYKHIHLPKIISILFLSNMMSAFCVYWMFPPLF